jgi:hypothetical protein
MPDWRQMIRLGSGAAALLAVAGCSKNLPMTPSELTQGLVIYTHANYLGDSGHITTSIPNLADYDGPCRNGDPDGVEGDPNWDECISSIRLAPGWRATVYRDSDYRGTSLEVTFDEPNLQLVPGNCPHDGMNDCITSIRVFGP